MEILGITGTALSSLAGALCMALLVGIMLVLGSRRLHFIWAFFCAIVFIYLYYFYRIASVHDPASAQFLWKLDYIGTILVPFVFLHFVLEFTGRARIWLVSLIYLCGLTFVCIDLTTNLVVNQVTYMFGELYFNAPPGMLHPYLVAAFVVFGGMGHYLLFKAWRYGPDRLFRIQARNIFVGIGIGFLGAGMNFFPVYGIPIYPATNLTVVFGSAVIAYTILRYRLFNLRMVMAQLLAFILLMSTLTQLIASTTRQGVIFSTILLVIVMGVGIFLIRSVKQEVAQRERIELLAKDLQKANDRLKELDVQKTEFISFATHQLRAPLTAMKGYASLVVEGDLGQIGDKAKDAVSRIYESAKTMTGIVDDYLNVSRIELGSMKYNFEPINMEKMVADVAAELRPNVEKAGLKLDFAPVGEGPWTVSADPDKLKQIISNLIDNSVKYTPAGTINVALERVPNMDGTIPVRFTVADTGIGINPEVMPKLFQKFTRADNANKQNIHGTGLGLFIVRELVTGQHGKVWAESPGEGKGSKFIVELPADASTKV